MERRITERIKEMRLTDLTNKEIEKIVQDIFSPNKITCIKRYKRDDHISVKIYTDWGEDDDIVTIADTIHFYNPFDEAYCLDDENGGFPIDGSDREKFKKFCYAHGIVGHLKKKNPYLKEHKALLDRINYNLSIGHEVLLDEKEAELIKRILE